MSTHSSDFDDLSEYSAHTFDTAETQSIDTVEELLQRFTLDHRPDCTLKLRNRVGPAVLGADLTYSIAKAESSGTLVVKPADRNSPWRRLKVDRNGTFTLRLATKWDINAGEIKRKKLIPLTDGAEGRIHWSVNYSMPSLEGNVGNEQVGEHRAELGHAHFSIPKVELVAWPQQLLQRVRSGPSPTVSAESTAAAATAETPAAAGPGETPAAPDSGSLHKAGGLFSGSKAGGLFGGSGSKAAATAAEDEPAAKDSSKAGGMLHASSKGGGLSHPSPSSKAAGAHEDEPAAAKDSGSSKAAGIFGGGKAEGFFRGSKAAGLFGGGKTDTFVGDKAAGGPGGKDSQAVGPLAAVSLALQRYSGGLGGGKGSSSREVRSSRGERTRSLGRVQLPAGDLRAYVFQLAS
ncbi:hypothetical protein N2152v2_002327 [Parachlorella kessleri]